MRYINDGVFGVLGVEGCGLVVSSLFRGILCPY